MLNKNIIIVISFVALALSGFRGHHFSSEKRAETSVQMKDTVTWKLLANINFLKKKDPLYGEVMYPVINQKLKEKQGKKIVAKGYIVPIDNKSFALSKNVFAQCFFCGNAGPETIMGIKFKGATPKLKTDQYVHIEGTFRYNDSDIEDWIYHIENAVITKGN